MCRRDSNAYGGGVAVYIQSHFLVMLREDLMSSVMGAGLPGTSKAFSLGVLL